MTENDVEYFGSPGPRQLSPRQAAARHAVLLVAAEAFTSRGYAATSIDDIADRLGATKGRVYHYFRTKGEIFLALHHRALELMMEATREAWESDAPAAVRLAGMAKAHALLTMNEATFMRLALQHGEISLAAEGRTRQQDIDAVVDLRHDYESRYEAVIAVGVEDGEFRGEDPGLLATIVLGTLSGMVGWLESQVAADDANRKRIATSLADFVTAGLQQPAKPIRQRASGSRQRELARS